MVPSGMARCSSAVDMVRAITGITITMPFTVTKAGIRWVPPVTGAGHPWEAAAERGTAEVALAAGTGDDPID